MVSIPVKVTGDIEKPLRFHIFPLRLLVEKLLNTTKTCIENTGKNNKANNTRKEKKW